MDTALGFDAPVVRIINGQKQEFPRLELPDLKKIGEAIQKQKAGVIERLAEQTKLSNWEKFRAYQELEFLGVPLADVLRYGRTFDGIEAFNWHSSQKLGRDEGTHRQLMKQLGPIGQFELASQLLSAPEAPPQQEEQPGARPEKPVPFVDATPSPKAA